MITFVSILAGIVVVIVSLIGVGIWAEQPNDRP